MNYSAQNFSLWNPVIQFGIISLAFLVASFLRRKFNFIRKCMIPSVVIAGMILLFLRTVGILHLDTNFLESITYHGIAIGFIALSLKPRKKDKDSGTSFLGLKSGAIIVSTYLAQEIVGLIISIPLAITVIPKLIPAAGILLPMGYGQGPGQANNIGSLYEAAGLEGGRSFAMAIAATGYLCACVVGIIITNVLVRKGKIKKNVNVDIKKETVLDFVYEENELEQESICDMDNSKEMENTKKDALTNSSKSNKKSGEYLCTQLAVVVLVYMLTFLASKYIYIGINAISESAAKSVNSIIWGFNFIFGSALAILVRTIIEKLFKRNLLKKVDKMKNDNKNIDTRFLYKQTFLDESFLGRVSDIAFDVMIIAGIASIDINEIEGLWIPFILITVFGAIVTYIHLSFVCKKVYPNYYYEGLLSMYGMLTGTISSGVLLLKEVDPKLKSPAANNLVIGSSFAILLGFPQLILVGMAQNSLKTCLIIFGIVIAYFIMLLCIIYFLNPKKNHHRT